MKPLSLFTFSIFLVLFGVNLYRLQSDKLSKFGSKSQAHRSLFEMEPEQARALLDDLDVYVKKNKSSKLSKRQIKTRTEEKRIRKIITDYLH